MITLVDEERDKLFEVFERIENGNLCRFSDLKVNQLFIRFEALGAENSSSVRVLRKMNNQGMGEEINTIFLTTPSENLAIDPNTLVIPLS